MGKGRITWRKGHDRGCGSRSLGVFNNFGLLSLHDGDARVGGAQIDADHVARDSRGLEATSPENIVLAGQQLGGGGGRGTL